MQDKKYIKFYHFRSLFTSQPFFVWHTLVSDEDLDEEDLINKEEYWEIVYKKDGLNFGKILNQFNLFIEKIFIKDIYNSPTLTYITGKIKNKIKATYKSIKQEKGILLYPCFKYKNAIAQPFAYDAEKKEIIDLKVAAKTSLKDLLKIFYNYSIITKSLGCKINNYKLILINKTRVKKNKVDFLIINKIFLTKAASLPGSKKSNEIEIMTLLNKNQEYLVLNQLSSRLKTNSWSKIKKVIYENFDIFLKKINEAKKTKKPSLSEIEKDVTIWGTNPKWIELLQYFKLDYAKYSGSVIHKPNIAANPKNPLAYNEKVKHLIKEHENKAQVLRMDDLKTWIKMIQDSEIVVWYDFEGFILPVAIVDYSYPNTQLAFQVSVIKTKNNKEYSKNNLVLDPQTISCDDLFKLILTIYDSNAEAYIVYNKNYENKQLESFLEILEANKFRNLNLAQKMVEEIIDKTYDLYDCFRITGRTNVPMVLLPDQGGRASIKNVEKHINKNNIKLPRMIKSYSDLEISNGLMAMEIAIKRRLGKIGDNEWVTKVKELKKYCENDVKAMIMTYDFLLYLINNS